MKNKEAPISDEEILNYELSVKDSDEKLIKKIDAMISDGEGALEARVKHIRDNTRWFDGKQWENERLEFQSDTVINRIFPGIRAMVGLATDSRPKADILPAPADTPEQAEVNKSKAKKLGLLFDQRWDELQMNLKSTKTIFRAMIHDDAYWTPFWNYYDNDFDVDLMRPDDVIIDPTANTVEEARYIIFQPYKNRKWFQDNFPDKVDQIKFNDVREAKGDDRDTQKVKGQARIHDVWTDEVRVLRCGKTILLKGPNPLYEFRSDEEQLNDWVKAGNEETSFVPIRNYFRRPRKPLIIIPTYNTGELHSRSIMDQLKPVQRTIDKRKQQIDENANLMANAQWIYDTNYLDSATADMLTNQPGLQIGIDGVENIKKVSGADMPSFVLNDLQHSEATFDNILGHHDISRGAKEMTNTATEATLLKEADQTPVRLLVRNYEGAVLELYQWWLQLASLFYTEEHYIRVWGEDGVQEFQTVSQKDITDGINIIIRPGSTLPVDKASIKQDVVQLAQIGLIDPLTLFEVMELPDPMKSANRLLNWKLGIISDEPPPPPQGMQQQPAEGEAPPPEKGQGQGQGQQVPPDVEWALAEQQRIAQGEMPQIRPEMVTPQMLQIHQEVLDSGEFPEEDMLIEHMQAELEILEGGQQDMQQAPLIEGY